MNKTYYKVLKSDLTNLGLLNAPKYQYHSSNWNIPIGEINNHKMKGGGLWVCHTESQAKAMVKYMKRKYGMDVIIKRCIIGEVIFQTSCRVKTDKLKFID